MSLLGRSGDVDRSGDFDVCLGEVASGCPLLSGSVSISSDESVFILEVSGCCLKRKTRLGGRRIVFPFSLLMMWTVPPLFTRTTLNGPFAFLSNLPVVVSLTITRSPGTNCGDTVSVTDRW